MQNSCGEFSRQKTNRNVADEDSGRLAGSRSQGMPIKVPHFAWFVYLKSPVNRHHALAQETPGMGADQEAWLE
ncbi:unnamed protein product [Mesocestoides corti]|uniref:Uncharacterized protein n=1 Tax=Mesocestoides corti TaxID=53468 RepID=A0A0R3UNQ3_MESCO|nr:unnamed protein product [Mesocestoides corti]